MSRRKQSNPKPIKLDEEEEEEEEELEEEVANSHSRSERGVREEVGNENEEKTTKTTTGTKTVPNGVEVVKGGVDEPTSPYECPVCRKNLNSQHEFTVHIRMHNSEEHTVTHTCSLCGKTLSSASSLDRHMLVHSGERPFKCSRCNMAFTTNGNMHRHMRTHHGESSSANHANHDDELRRSGVKRGANSPRPQEESTRKVMKDEKQASAEATDDGKSRNEQSQTTFNRAVGEKSGELEEQLHCPVCSKTFLCKYGLQTHLETHPNYVFRCQQCELTFKNYRGLNRHQHVVHVKANGSKKDGKVDGTRNRNATVGFQDLTFIGFSTSKFALVAKAICEQNARRPSSAFHTFECYQCKKAFPCGSALKMHLKSHNNGRQLAFGLPSTNDHREQNSSDQCECLVKQVPFADKENFLAVLGLQATSPASKEERTSTVEEPYENPTYFTHGMPFNHNNVYNNIYKIHNRHQSVDSCSTQTSDGEDFADIQSILSLTTSPALLPKMNGGNAVSAASASPRRGLAVNPESPAMADSATASPKLPSDVSEQAATSTPHSLENGYHGRFPCKLCPLVFPNLRALKGHNRSHLGISPYRCNMCSYTSIDKSTLLRHLRTHNGERPYQCKLCQYAFTTKANCERHMRKRHGKQNKQEMRNAMRQKLDLQDAADTLNSFHCPDTVCKYCNVDFKFYRVLRHHLRSLHSSCARKPFQCRQCHMGFSTKNNCYRHVLKQHPELKDHVEEMIWCCYSDTVVSPEKDAKSDRGDVSTDDEEEDAPDSPTPTPSLSPGPPVLDPVMPIDNERDADSEMSSVEALVNWSTRGLANIPLQEEPLDLAVHPVDLTLKKSCVLLTKDQSLPPTLPKICQLNSSSIPTSSLSTPSCLPPPPSVVQSSPFVSRQLCNTFNSHHPLTAPELSPGSSSSPASSVCSLDTPGGSYQLGRRFSSKSSTSSVATNLVKQQQTTGNVNGNGVLLKKQKQKRYRTERPFRCDHCEAGFTLRSNMERHIKQQHPDQWLLRSRNRKTNVSLAGGASTCQVRPLLPRLSHDSTITRPISNQVKEAISQQIRQRLAISATASEKQVGVANGAALSSSTVSMVRTSKQVGNDVQEQAQDLVSVSRLLDTATAQNIQEIFRHSDSAKDAAHKKSASASSSDETKGETVKRSAYTNAPHRVSCPFCQRRFPWTSSLRRHILTHTGQKPFKCPHCPLLFTTKSNCDRHLVRKHGGVAGDPDNRTAPERPYRCTLCPNSAFSTPSNLRKHLQQKHGHDEGKVLWDDMMESSCNGKTSGSSLRDTEDTYEDEEEEDDDEDEDEDEEGRIREDEVRASAEGEMEDDADDDADDDDDDDNDGLVIDEGDEQVVKDEMEETSQMSQRVVQAEDDRHDVEKDKSIQVAAETADVTGNGVDADVTNRR